MLEKLRPRFDEIYGEGGEIRSFFAPGRVNLLGDHTDYNGGRVFPCALEWGTYGLIRPRWDRTVRVASLDAADARVEEFSLDGISREAVSALGESWARYPMAVIGAMAENGYALPSGFDALYGGDLPIGAGLSSSSSLCVLTALMLKTVFGFADIDGPDTALMARKAENDFIGVASGIMDPFASAMGMKDHGIFLASQRLRYEYVPLHLGSAKIVLTDSLVRQKAGLSAFDKRHEECAKALKKLKVVSNITYLCDMNVDTFNNCKDVIMNEDYTKRAKHAVTENARAIRGVSALRVGNLKRFGELMNQSHVSLRDDYVVSCPELDCLAETAWNTPGVIGSRMTGAGLGGCTVSIIEEDAIGEYEARATAAFQEKFGKEPQFYVVSAGDGARELY